MRLDHLSETDFEINYEFLAHCASCRLADSSRLLGAIFQWDHPGCACPASQPAYKRRHNDAAPSSSKGDDDQARRGATWCGAKRQASTYRDWQVAEDSNVIYNITAGPGPGRVGQSGLVATDPGMAFPPSPPPWFWNVKLHHYSWIPGLGLYDITRGNGPQL